MYRLCGGGYNFLGNLVFVHKLLCSQKVVIPVKTGMTALDELRVTNGVMVSLTSHGYPITVFGHDKNKK